MKYSSSEHNQIMIISIFRNLKEKMINDDFEGCIKDIHNVEEYVRKITFKNNGIILLSILSKLKEEATKKAFSKEGFESLDLAIEMINQQYKSFNKKVAKVHLKLITSSLNGVLANPNTHLGTQEGIDEAVSRALTAARIYLSKLNL